MSFDLKIINGDLAIGSNNDLDKVINTDKLIQDVLKLLMTELGANPFFPWYGSPLSSSVIGTSLDEKFIVSIAENQIRSGIETIINLQREQSVSQKVSASELIAAIKAVSVVRNLVDPRMFTVEVEVIAKSLRVAKASFDITL